MLDQRLLKLGQRVKDEREITDLQTQVSVSISALHRVRNISGDTAINPQKLVSIAELHLGIEAATGRTRAGNQSMLLAVQKLTVITVVRPSS